MSEHAQSFINHLIELKDRERGAFAQLKRSLSFDPGAYPRAYPYVERFVGAEKHADDPWRKALYLTAGLFAFHPMHKPSASFAAAFGELGRARDSASIEQRFIALLGAEPESLPTLLRQAISLLAADGLGCDFASLLDDLARWLNSYDREGRDRLRQRWARDFYRTYDGNYASASDTTSKPTANE
jgi:CRISPR system Cascade subunit CasB